MKLCLLCTEFFAWGKYGGFGRAARTIGREMALLGHEVHAVVPLRGKQREREELDGVIVHGFPMHKPWQVLSICREIDADIYHSCEPSMSTFFAERAAPHCKHMVTCRDPRDSHDWWLEFKRPSVSYLQVMANWVNEHNPLVIHSVRRADVVYVPARFLKAKVERLYHPPSKVRFLPTPIPIPDAVKKSQRPTVCFVARLDRRKRPERFCALAERHPDIRFIIVGKSRDSDYEQRLREQYAHCSNLEFAGFINQFRSERLSEILTESWILVNTATREGLPNAFLEAMAHRCAILSAVNPDQVASRFGYLVKGDDFDEGLRWLLEENRWRERGDAGHNFVASTFSVENAMAAHLQAYGKLLAGDPFDSPEPDPKARVRLLMVSYEYPPLGGGGAKVVHSLAQELTHEGQKLDLVTMRAGSRAGVVPAFPGLNIRGIPCYRSNPNVCYAIEMVPYLLLAFPYLLFRVRNRRYTVNHTHFIFPDGLLAYLVNRLTGLPYVLTAHGSDVPGYNPDRFTGMHRWLSPVWKRIVDSANRIICPSEYIESLIKEVSAEARTLVIPNGIDTDRFSADREKNGSILVVTRMFERKGVQYLLEALADWKGHPLVNIVGDGPFLPKLRYIAQELGVAATFHGFVDNRSQQFKDLIEAASVFVFTSEAENFPVVLLEAMTAGLAIVTTDDTGCAEAVGDAAIRVPPRDSLAIRNALRSLVDDPNRVSELQKKSRARVVEHFGLESVTRAHRRLYEEVGNLNPPGFVGG